MNKKTFLFGAVSGFLISVIIYVSCINNKEGMISINSHSRSIDSLQLNVFKYGDTSSYDVLMSREYLDFPRYEEMFFWSFIMANKYGYAPAYYDVYLSLKDFHNCEGYSLKEMDGVTRKIAIEYLQKAAEKKYADALFDIDSVVHYNP